MLENVSLQEMVERKWSSRAQSYSDLIHEELNGHKKGAWLKEIDSLVSFSDSRTPRVLDIGTGPGFFSIVLTENGWRVTGIDCAKDMLKVAKANAAEYGVSPEFLEMDSHKLGFSDNTFDLLLCRNVTWTLYDPLAAYVEWRRVLRPGGYLLIFDANWYRHLFDREALERKMEAERKAKELYGLDLFVEENPQQSSSMYASLPMGRFQRPEWDRERLTELGFRDILIDNSLSERVLDDGERLQYSATPMFSIRAIKG
ncbi:MAG: methyltransferase domain-containing protein [Deltaproteobacteria bacterium]|jgi:SAM-dependent methyltransferase|nr:methyltransferase domain-containing protein [Deltaproteobacteria bacterium]